MYAKRKERFEEETKKQLVGNIVLTRLVKDICGVHFVSDWDCNVLWLFLWPYSNQIHVHNFQVPKNSNFTSFMPD